MEGEFSFTDIMGDKNKVRFKVVQNEADYRKYGIYAEQLDDSDRLIDSVAAEERFITKTEAEMTIGMLCEYQVMPCTLCDII